MGIFANLPVYFKGYGIFGTPYASLRTDAVSRTVLHMRTPVLWAVSVSIHLSHIVRSGKMILP